jgi:hypothetical protein
MAKADFPLSVNRRRLLTAAAAITATGIVPTGNQANAAAAAVIQSSAIAPEAKAANFRAATATRLAEIAKRNRLRKESALPLLPVAKELRRMKTAADAETFERFRYALREPVFQTMLARARRQHGDAAWTPKDFCERWQFSREVEMRLKKLYERVG